MFYFPREDKMNRSYCVKCGKENSVEGAGFCAFCGGQLRKEELSPDVRTERICAELKSLYINYINWSADYMANRSAGTILAGMFTGNGDYKNREEHARFVQDCEKAAGQLLAALEGGSGVDALQQLLDYVLFEVYSHCGDEAGWMIMACERYYLPLLDHLPGDQPAQLYERYKAFRKKKMNLPAQDEMLKKLKKLAKSRG